MDRGIGKITFLVFATLIGSVVFYGFNVFPFYYNYFELQNQMDQVVRVASTYNDQELREKLNYHIKHMGLPVETQDLKLFRQDGVIKVSLQWDEVFHITWRDKDYEIQDFHFHAHAEGSVAPQ